MKIDSSIFAWYVAMEIYVFLNNSVADIYAYCALISIIRTMQIKSLLS